MTQQQQNGNTNNQQQSISSPVELVNELRSSFDSLLSVLICPSSSSSSSSSSCSSSSSNGHTLPIAAANSTSEIAFETDRLMSTARQIELYLHQARNQMPDIEPNNISRVQRDISALKAELHEKDLLLSSAHSSLIEWRNQMSQLRKKNESMESILYQDTSSNANTPA